MLQTHTLLTSKQRAETLRRTKSSYLGGKTFVAVGQHITDGSDSVAATVTNTEAEIQHAFSNLIVGQKLSTGDIVALIDRQTWSNGEIYPQYSSGTQTNAFVVVEQGATKYVYKCLSNNLGAASTAVPSGTATAPFEESDGYVWQYMFTVDETTFNRFATETMIPLVEDQTVTDAATGGTVDAILITEPGLDFTNTTSGTFRAEDITTGNSLAYKLTTDASAIDDFYNGCMIEIITPSSPAFGEMVEILDYNGTTKAVTLAEEFSAIPEIGDAYEVSPGVSIATNSVPSTPAKIRAVVEEGVVQSFIIADRGAGYRTTTVSVNADASVGATDGIYSAQVSPANGHGSDILAESYGRALAIQSDVVLGDLGVEETNDVRTVTLIEDPRFDGVAVTLTSGNPERFAINETLRQYRSNGTLDGNTTFTSPSTLTANTEQLAVGDSVLITNGSQRLMVDITGISNTTSAVVEGNFAGSFEGTGEVVRLTGEATVASRSGSDIIVDGAQASLASGTSVYGMASRSVDTITSVTINSRPGLDQFSQIAQLTGSFPSGVFVQDETVIGADGAEAIVHSISATEDTVGLTVVSGVISAQQYTGQTSGATFDATSTQDREVALDSGEILFINNFTPISISSNKKISTKIVIEF